MSMGWLLVVTGIVFLLSPFPIGIFFMAAGLSVLIYASETISDRISLYRQKHVALDRQLHWVEEKLSRRVKFVSVAVGRTRPAITPPSDSDNIP